MPLEIGGDPADGLEWQPFPQQGGGGGRNGSGDAQPPCAAARQTQGGRAGRSGRDCVGSDSGVADFRPSGRAWPRGMQIFRWQMGRVHREL